MANYETLKTAIQSVVKTNGNNEITGALLQQVLLAMINSLGSGYQFLGVATPATSPGTPDQKVCYLAMEKGVYPNFNNIEVGDNEIAFMTYDSQWHGIKVETGSAGAGLADGAVTTAKIADGAVSMEKLAAEVRDKIDAATGGGGGVKRLYMDINGGALTDPGQLASNAALYTEILTALTNDELPPQVGILAAGGGIYEHLMAFSITYLNSNLRLTFFQGKTAILIILMSNGNASYGD